MAGFTTTSVSRNTFLACCAWGAVVTQVFAQSDDTGLEIIMITAQKRAENIQDVPLSIMAISGEKLQNAGIQSLDNLGKLVPSLVINNTITSNGIVLRIRGFGSPASSAVDPDVATYLDGALVPRPGALVTSFLDVQGVEVLSGPQGTLSGRNAAMGALLINTNPASTDNKSFEAQVEGGRYGTYAGTAIANVPLTQSFALRFAIKETHTDGLYDNLFDGRTYGRKNETIARLASKVDFSDNLTWDLRIDGSRIDGDGVNPLVLDANTATPAQVAAFGAFVTSNGGSPPVSRSNPSFTVNQRFNTALANSRLRDRDWGVNSTFNWALSPNLTLRLLDAYRDWRNEQTFGDPFATTLDFLMFDASSPSRSHSHELQLVSAKNAFANGKLGFTSGLYYFHEDTAIGSTGIIGSQFCGIVFGGFAPFLVPACQAGPQYGALNSSFSQRTNSYAAYVQGTYELLPTVDLDVGVRHTWDRKSGSFAATDPNPIAAAPIQAVEGPESLSFKDGNTSVRASLSWHITDQVMGFFTYSTGYKSGGFNNGAAAPALTPATRNFGPETVKDFELGLKSVVWDDKVQLNTTLFNTKLDDYQDRSFNGTTFVYRNAGDVRSRGVDIDSQVRVLPRLALNFAATYLNAIYASDTNAPGLEGCPPGGTPTCPAVQDLSGRGLDFAPRWHGNVGVQWTSPEFLAGYTITVAPSENFQSSMLTSNTLNSGSRVPGYATTDLRIGLKFPDPHWELEFVGTNIFDRHYFEATQPQVLAFLAPGVNNPSTGATLWRGYLADPARFMARLTAKF